MFFQQSPDKYHQIFRGKYELEFLLKIIHKILYDSYKEKSIVKEKIQFSFGDASNLNQEQIMSVFSVYAETPPSLLDYIQRVLGDE